jgi:Tol biopolymer transport system component
MNTRPESLTGSWSQLRRLQAVRALLIAASLLLEGSGRWGVFGADLAPSASENPTQLLALEVRQQGWIVYAGRSPKGDWDLFLCRPDGSKVRNLTQTPEHNEFSAQFSRDGKRMLYRRMPRTEKIDNNAHGTQGELVLANSDGTQPVALGKAGEFPWASWSPDGRQFASLSIQGITIVDMESRKVVRTLARKGFFQQMTWSPDGEWLCGVANSFGASWSIARMRLSTGEASAINRVDCCTPDWFPDSQQVIFSWRPPGQQANKGYGWTQLWRADAEGKTSQLVYGEDGRHVYGGQVSPDGKHVLFTGNMEEDGDPGNAGGPMALMRLSDAPIIGGESKELRARHPEAKKGPVLVLPAGWEPCWTASELPTATTTEATGAAAPENGGVNQLASELHTCGWLVFSAKNDRGDWDLFLSRPDGSNRQPITDTPDFNEAGARFSPDGKCLLFYRLPKAEAVDNNTYGTFELVMADADGRNPVIWGKDFSWASWGPDGRQIACLTMKGIQIIDVATRGMVRQIPRQGIVSQLVWSPDGKAFVGTANGLGPFWNIGRLDLATGILQAVSETERYNCTPDWTSDATQVLYARGIIPEKGGRAELWAAAADGKGRRTLYAEAGRHIYGACCSPDGKYVLFTRSVEDLGRVDNSRTTMAVMRWSDAPMIGDHEEALRKRFPEAKTGPRLDLGPGWEPHWTLTDVLPSEKGKSK